MSDSTIEQIRQFIVTNFLFDDSTAMLPDDASLLERGIIDSTGVLALVMFVEETFGIEVADEDVTPENFDTVNNLANYARSRVATEVA